MSSKDLIIEGARQNNLRNISLSLPHNRVIAVTGVSGSGKSSLAFDTVFAEGQWRFIESLSTYARLFLEKLDRPDVDAIHNIRPAVALEQKNPVRGSRSTVGTLTELYEFYRLLYAKVGTPHCPKCGREIRKWDPAQIAASLKENYAGERIIILFRTAEPLEDLRRRGFARVWVNGQIEDIAELAPAGPALGTEKSKPSPLAPAPSLDVVLDRLVVKDDPRLADSLEMAWKEGRGRITVVVMGGQEARTVAFSSENACEECGISVPEASAILFSFNHPVGACPECKGFGNTLLYDEDLFIPDKGLSLSEGAIDPWNKPAYRWWKKHALDKGKKAGLDVRKPLRDFTDAERDLLFKGTPGFYGINDFFEDLEGRRYKLHVRVFLSRYRRGFTCPSCKGKRLTPEALAYRIGGLDIADLCGLSVAKSIRFFQDLDLGPFRRDVSKELVRQIMMKLKFLDRVGLDYLTLDRYGKTLSGGEYQRINLSNQLASLLTGTLYVLDEPTVGLHPRDTERIAAIMSQLSGLGNTVIVVEHDPGIIGKADWIVELGPGGGHRGGTVVFSGSAGEYGTADTLTARYLRGEEKVQLDRQRRGAPADFLSLSGARGNNLKGVDLRVPLQRFVTVTGVSGSGKSSLVVETLYRALSRDFRSTTEPPLPHDRLEGAARIAGVKLIDQSPIGRSPRSNPVTYLKVFDHIRKLFAGQREAKALGYGPGFFSFNVPGGRCETCKGEGFELMEMYFFEDLYVRCEKCEGRRYRPEALRVRYRGKSIHDVLSMTVEEAFDLFGDVPAVSSRLGLMMDTGLGYLRLGQPATTLSGGEAQRLKICAEMTGAGDSGLGVRKTKTKTLVPNPGSLYIFDEPTVGLHFQDIQALLTVLHRLVDAGNTVLVIEHNLDVVRSADWVVDLGPEGGDGGGRIIFEGTPEELVRTRTSITGKYLKAYIKSR